MDRSQTNRATPLFPAAPARRVFAAALLASGWVLPAAVLAGLLATRLRLWNVAPPLLLGSPPDVLLVRAFIFGAGAALLFPHTGLRLLLAGACVVDLLYLRTRGFLPLTPGAVAFDVLAVAFCFVPAQLFSRWTHEDRRLTLRAALHPVFHAALLLGILPAAIVALGGGSWAAAFARPSWLNKLYLQLLLVPATLLISAVQEFLLRGRGTPMPADPPRCLVTTGPYAYLANPMQLGKIVMLAGWGWFWWNPWFVAAAALGLSYSAFLAVPREERVLAGRFGARWSDYRAHVRRWWPRWRPHHRSTCSAVPPARLYLDLACGSCSELAVWLRARSPVGLEIVSAADHPAAPLRRMRYDPADGAPEDDGIVAFARALDHLNLAWAFCGWMLRLPLVSRLAQLIADAFDSRAAIACVTGGNATTPAGDLP